MVLGVLSQNCLASSMSATWNCSPYMGFTSPLNTLGNSIKLSEVDFPLVIDWFQVGWWQEVPHMISMIWGSLLCLGTCVTRLCNYHLHWKFANGGHLLAAVNCWGGSKLLCITIGPATNISAPKSRRSVTSWDFCLESCCRLDYCQCCVDCGCSDDGISGHFVWLCLGRFVWKSQVYPQH